MTLGHLPAKE